MAWLFAAALVIVEQFKLLDKLQAVKIHLHPKMMALYGDNREQKHSKHFAAQVLLIEAGGLIALIILVALTGGDLALLFCGFLLILCIPLALYKELDLRIKRKKQAIVLELPDLLNRMTLLLNAGETVQGAFLRCASNRFLPGDSIESARSPLQKEIALLASGIQNREPFHLLMERLSKRCAVQEISVFTTTVLMNYKRGGDSFVLALKALSSEMWERRKAITRTLGEEASSKLIFPMLLIFLVVMTIVAAPAVSMMNQP
ncbi:MAG: type secretion protein [Paenibacillus sp.]|nr:type secretion protein [Paenibacillus sp.]